MISVFKVKKHDISQEIKKEILYTYIVYEIYLVKVCPPSIWTRSSDCTTYTGANYFFSPSLVSRLFLHTLFGYYCNSNPLTTDLNENMHYIYSIWKYGLWFYFTVDIQSAILGLLDSSHNIFDPSDSAIAYFSWVSTP